MTIADQAADGGEVTAWKKTEFSGGGHSRNDKNT